MLKTISISKLSIFSLICFFSFSCAAFNQYQGATKESDQIKEFYSGRGNATVSPPYQNWSSIHGLIKEDTIYIHFTKAEKGKMSEKDLELTGADYQKSLELIKNTHVIEKEQANGANLPGIELTYNKCLKISGEPVNKKEWDDILITSLPE